MARLHLIANTLSLESFENHLQRLVSEGDELLFFADAVLCVMQKDIQSLIKQTSLSTYLLQSDVSCRGLSESMPSNIEQVNDTKMVELCAQSEQVISW